MPHDQPPSDTAGTRDEPRETAGVEWEAKWTRKDRADHLLFVPSASDRDSIEEFLVVDPASLRDLSEWR
ncbi:hypothetical protein [Salinirubrum litoreum]|uniref:Uncharacterized protein n=1 Tax=Salinirubrum litoreum TaxID=1126234 RepID=A0ABD5RFI2_9EURY|nr:hypothetical protein [Salinirubrum litoreum]